MGRELGKGSFARVMKVCLRATGQWFAAKLILNSRMTDGTHAVNAVNFAREIAIMKSLKHPNICRLHEVFLEKNSDIGLLICGPDLNETLTY
jgi:ser/thr/tyr protein kinase RAD53